MDSHHEIVCPEYALDDGASVVVIPWYLICGCPYPIQVYLYACDIYSANPDYGQRKVAAATKSKFKLKKFSHSTVCRSFKKIEQFQKQALERRFGEEFKANNDKSQTQTNTPIEMFTESQGESCDVRRFPSVKDTAKRREQMAKFLQAFHNAAIKEDNIEAAGQLFVKHWYDKTRRLLI
jgi:hypothetical protein